MTEEKSLSELINAAQEKPWGVPMHVLGRLEFLIGDEEVLFADATLTAGEQPTDGYTGRVFVLTTSKVVVATFKDSVDLTTSDHSSSSTADAKMWPRTRLRGVALRGFEDKRNPDRWWQADYGDLWPHDAHVELQYEGEEPITLPLSTKEMKPQRRAIRAIVPGILKNLN